MRGTASQPCGIARLARALGLDSNPLRRASDRAEARIRIGLVAIFLIVGPLAAQGREHAQARGPRCVPVTYLPRMRQRTSRWLH